MENKEDIVRLKEEPKDAGDDNMLDSVDSCKTENFGTSLFYESSANHENGAIALSEKLNEKIFVDFECKNVKTELKPLLATVCKTEYQNSLPIVKIENENQINDIDGKIFIDFECKDFKIELNHLKIHAMNIHNWSKPFE
ncbi:hypothetical protein TKK_0004352 [Trichogramma kaykai]